MAALRHQAALIRAAIYDDVFIRSSSVVKQCFINDVKFVPPVAKSTPAFQQRSPLGASRVIADSASIDEHITRALRVVKFLFA